MDEMRLFKVAIQARPGGNLDMYDWKAKSGLELVVQLKKMYELPSVTSFAFLEVHEILPDGSVKILYGDLNKLWPDVPVKVHGGIVRGKNVEFEKNNLEKFNVGSAVMETRIDTAKVAEKILEPEKNPNEKDVGIRPLELKVA